MNATTKEVELKLQAPAEWLDRLPSHPKFRDKLKHPLSEQTLVSTYFDSDDFSLRSHGINLRVRQIGDRNIQTVKAAPVSKGPYFARTEIETEIPSKIPDLNVARDGPLTHPIIEEIRDQIKPIFETRVQRKLFRVTSGDSEIEMALDHGRIIAGGTDLPISEIELELKRGHPSDIFKLAQQISAIAPVQLAVESKADRGYGLLTHARVTAKADPIVLSPSTSVGEAFKAIAHSCLRQIVSNAAAVVSCHANALHQMRVGMRRLRVAIWLFSDLLNDEQAKHIRDWLKHFGGELAPARDLEVMVTDVLRPFGRRYPKDKGVASLMRSFARRRTQAYDRAIQTITSGEFRKFTIDCAAWIESGAWTSSSQPNSDMFSQSIAPYAAHRISRQRKKLLSRGRRLVDLDADQLHDLRIRAKKFRYTAEFFRSLYSNPNKLKRWSRSVSRLQDLQDALGSYNDMTVRRRLFLEFTARAPAKRNPAVAFAAGQIVGEQHADSKQLLKDGVKALSRLEEIKTFWKMDAADFGTASSESQEAEPQETLPAQDEPI